jgi:hypothetical protein
MNLDLPLRTIHAVKKLVTVKLKSDNPDFNTCFNFLNTEIPMLRYKPLDLDPTTMHGLDILLIYNQCV